MNHFPLTLIIFILSIPAYSDTPPPSSTDRLKEGTANLYFTTTRARNSVSASSPLLYTGGTFSIPAATSSANGYLTSGNWTLFNSKEPPLASGLSTQYFRGDKTWALLDTSSVPENGNLYFTNGRVDTEFDTRLATKSTSNLAEGSNLYFTNARVDTEFDTRLATKSTSNLAEGSNLYYTTGRFDTALATKTTSNLTEGSNLYFTNARVDTEFDTRLATKSTTNLAEGTNLYYTDARVQTAAKNNTSAQTLYVSQDKGNDSTGDGSFLKPYQTIGAAITAANSISAYYRQVIVRVRPSTGSNGYNENITLSQQGVNLLCENPTASAARSCLVNGSLTINLTGTTGSPYYVAASNEVYISGMQFSPPSGTTALVFSGSTYQRIFIYNSYFGGNNSAAVATITNTGTNGGNVSGLRVWDTTFENNSSTNETMTLTAGTVYFYGTTSLIQNDNAAGPSVNQNGGSTLIASLVQLVGQYKQVDNTSVAYFNLSSINSGTNSCISTPASPSTGFASLAYFGCTSSNTNSITGSGVVGLLPGSARLSTSGDIATTVNSSVVPGLPQGEVMIGAGATTGTNVALSIKDGHIKVAQTTAPTTTLSANAGTGGTPACTITNGTDSDGKISLKTGSTSGWATGVQCTINFNKSWGTAPICVFSPSNATAASVAVSQQINFPDATTSAQTISAGVAFASQVTATWHYHCEESQ